MGSLYDHSAQAPKTKLVRELEQYAAVIGFIGALFLTPWTYGFVRPFIEAFIGEYYGAGYWALGVTVCVQGAIGYLAYKLVSKLAFLLLFAVVSGLIWLGSRASGGFSATVPVF